MSRLALERRLALRAVIGLLAAAAIPARGDDDAPEVTAPIRGFYAVLLDVMQRAAELGVQAATTSLRR